MTDAEKIAEWIGWQELSDHHGIYWENKDGMYREPETLLTDDTVAVEILPVLVERGYGCHLNGSLAGDFITFDFFIRHKPKENIESVCQPTICKAITSAILQLIEKEGI